MTTTHIITFLGRPWMRDGEKVARTEYRSTSYRFPDDADSTATSFFGHALLDWCIANKRDGERHRLLVLGTTTSMWDALFYLLPDSCQDDHALECVAAIENALAPGGSEPAGVSDGVLARLSAILTNGLGIPVDLRLIEYGVTPEQRLNIIGMLAAEVAKHDEVWLDVTHGFRHLPLLTQAAAVYMQTLQGASIRGVMYAPFDLTEEGATPVLALQELLTFHKWSQHASAYAATADVRQLIPMLQASGVSTSLIDQLELGALYERTMRWKPMRDAYRAAYRELLAVDISQTPAGLFVDRIRAALSEFDGIGDMQSIQRAAGKRALRSREWVRAAACAHEAVVSQHIEERGRNPEMLEERIAGRKALNRKSPRFRELGELRNALAHGQIPSGRRKVATVVTALLERPDDLFEYLQRALNRW